MPALASQPPPNRVDYFATREKNSLDIFIVAFNIAIHLFIYLLRTFRNRTEQV
jgi:hypothetical protein